jgi:hypothetical protein
VRTNLLIGEPAWSSDPEADGQDGEHDGQAGFDRAPVRAAIRDNTYELSATPEYWDLGSGPHFVIVNKQHAEGSELSA